MEEWKPIYGFPNYSISSYGRVLNQQKGTFLKQQPDIRGYLRVALSKGKVYWKSVHRLVATHFIPNPKNKPEVNHLGAKDDNRVSMLEWVTHIENMKHAQNIIKRYAVAVKRICPKTLEETIYASIKDAVAEGFKSNAIVDCCSGRRPTSGGFIWYYIETIDNDDLPGEVWKDLGDSQYEEINVFPHYQVSNLGRIKNRFNKVVKIRQTTNSVTLSYNKVSKNMYIHRVVIMGFNIPNPDNKPLVDHIDTNRTNNALSNLRWVTNAENMNNITTASKRKETPISRTCLTTGDVYYYKYIKDVEKDGFDRKRVSNVLRTNTLLTYLGNKWTKLY